MQGGVKNYDFRPISRFISEMMQATTALLQWLLRTLSSVLNIITCNNYKHKSDVRIRHRRSYLQVAQLSHSRRETARRFVSLNILLSHSRSFEITLLSRACVSPYQCSIKIMSVSRTALKYSASNKCVTLKSGIRVVQSR